MDFDLTEEQRAFQATAREFAREPMMPFAREWDADEVFPVAACSIGGARRSRSASASRAQRALRVHQILEGSNEAMQLIVSRDLLEN